MNDFWSYDTANIVNPGWVQITNEVDDPPATMMHSMTIVNIDFSPYMIIYGGFVGSGGLFGEATDGIYKLPLTSIPFTFQTLSTGGSLVYDLTSINTTTFNIGNWTFTVYLDSNGKINIDVICNSNVAFAETAPLSYLEVIYS